MRLDDAGIRKPAGFLNQKQRLMNGLMIMEMGTLLSQDEGLSEMQVLKELRAGVIGPQP